MLMFHSLGRRQLHAPDRSALTCFAASLVAGSLLLLHWQKHQQNPAFPGGRLDGDAAYWKGSPWRCEAISSFVRGIKGVTAVGTQNLPKVTARPGRCWWQSPRLFAPGLGSRRLCTSSALQPPTRARVTRPVPIQKQEPWGLILLSLTCSDS